MKKRKLLWFWMLSKRLFKKPSFLVILLLIPALVLGYSAVDKQDSGMFTVALACRDPEDPVAVAMEDQLSSQLIRFRRCATPQEAQQLVVQGRADAAWIFQDRMQQRMEKFIRSRSPADALVQIVEREQSVPSLIAREKLTGVLYESCAKPFYLSYLRQYAPELDGMTDAELTRWFDQINLNGQLFEFETVEQAPQTDHFLMTPVRGLLGVLTVLAGLAAAMYYKLDRQTGTFSRVPERMQIYPEALCQLAAVLYVLLAVALALGWAGLTGSFGRELLSFLLLGLGTVGFSMVMEKLFRSLRAMAVALPLLSVGMIAICPVFYDLKSLHVLQLLFPATYFINGVYDPRYLLWGTIYSAGMLGLAFVLSRLQSNP